MNVSNQKVLLRMILDNNEYEDVYKLELIRELLSEQNSDRKFSFTTNTAYILNTYFQHHDKNSAVDGRAFEFVNKLHEDNVGGVIKVTIEVVEN